MEVGRRAFEEAEKLQRACLVKETLFFSGFVVLTLQAIYESVWFFSPVQLIFIFPNNTRGSVKDWQELRIFYGHVGMPTNKGTAKQNMDCHDTSKL